jgi:pectate disaccharide-lyase
VAAGRNVLRLTALTSGGLANLDHFEITGAPQYKLAVVLSGRGSVSLSPSNAYGYFNPGTSVTLTAQPLTNASFTGWSGALSGTNNPQALVVNNNVAVTATFQNAQAFNLYVSPAGNDSNPGTIDAPFYSLHTAVAAAFPGDVIYLRGGTYYYTNTVFVTGNNSSNNPVLITGYPGEQPVLSWTNWTPANETERGGARGLKITGSYWHLKGLEICCAPDNGIKCEGHHNTFERVVFHHNGDSGLQIGLNKEDYTTNPEPDARAAHNFVLNCDSYRNADPATSYENADGFACKLYAGRGNRFFGCRAWENCDDGWDCYQTEYEIVIENCWAWHNGDPSLWGFSSFNGDGNGFKLGGDSTYCPMTVLNCVALDCQWGTTVGFAFNNNTAPITLYNCSALNCGRPYKFAQDGNVFKNCLDWNSARPAPTDITGTSTQVNNSWNLSVTVTSADFVSVLASDAVAARQSDGSLPNNGFARLAAGSDLIDAGVDVGLPFNGAAPDLGAYEYGAP